MVHALVGSGRIFIRLLPDGELTNRLLAYRRAPVPFCGSTCEQRGALTTQKN